jgi:hypothetical protein
MRLTITDDVLTRAIDVTPDQAFSNAKNLISGVDKNIQAPSSAKPEFEISSGELKFTYERDLGGVKVKIGSVKVYKILKRILLIAGSSAIVSCVESDPDTDRCKKLIDEARDQMKKILASDPSIKKEIEGHATGPWVVAKGNSTRPNAEDAIFKTSLTAIELALQ